MKIKICADSTCDFTKELCDKYDVELIPLRITRGEDSLLDGIEITSDDIYKYYDETKQLCKTCAVNISEYLEIFERFRSEYDAIIHFTISSEMSSCYQNALLAAEDLTEIYSIDSRNLSTGIAHLVIDAKLMADSGMEAKEIADIINKKKEKLDVSFVVDNLEYLKTGGRCSSIAALGANLFHLKPCINVADGKMSTGTKYRGTFTKCLAAYVKDRLEGKDDIDYSRLFITHSGVDAEICEFVKAEVEKYAKFDEVLITRAGSTISCHCGPNTLGLLFYHK